ncbi:hypothetical protein OS493_003480 [Desmophyllum pertusum]|uniref:Uncharacterized protein n=1 Tax=Desmophyllum pertusum TaxID=174260 RepID=A0A9X0A6Q9_9CNID|nr:hypothetical protein OS493_003480 [Desmophyllum pertusum]
MKNLEQEKEKLVEEMLSEIENNNVEEQEKSKELEKENQQLIKYIDMLENESLGIHRGAGIPELKTKQAQNRKLKQLKTRAQKALHFVQIFGLDLQLLKLKEPNGNQTFSITLIPVTILPLHNKRAMKNEATLKSGENIKVKLSGDGARMSRMTNFILMSFSILQQVDEVLSSKGNHTIAVVNGSESRQSIEESFADVFREVNKVIDDGFIEVDGQRVGVEIFLGGDYKNFEDLYFNYISSWVPFATDVYRKKIKEWIDSFSTLGEKRTGYRKEKVTCYMHAAAYHIPQMVERNQNIKQFSGQGVEKNNDDARRIVQRKSNHNDDPAEVLRTEHRLGVLHHLQRKHRTYTKRAAEYWDEIIKTKRGKKQGISYSKKRTSTPQTQESITTKAKQKK